MTMFKEILLALLLIIETGLCANLAGVKTSEKFPHSMVLDSAGHFIIFWKFNETHITFEVHVQTKGWVGFGLSGNGNMFPGDVVVGWVNDDGTLHFADRHTTGHRIPELDKSQDWYLLSGEENDFGTVLKFVRRINTCDDEDEIIQEGTSRLIFAYGDHDPADDNSIYYHGTTRGTKSVSLLSTETVNEKLPDDSRHFDFLNENYLVPSDSTTYQCRGFKMPSIGKHHMIKFEAVVTPGNELNVHHIVLYRCDIDSPEKYDGMTIQCYDTHRTLPQCYSVVVAWAIGGEPFYFPDHVGFSVGGPEDAVFYIMETHYDNPTQKTDIIDNSGIRITITPTLRPNEAGMIQIGSTSNFFQVIPPGLENFVSKFYCHEDCLSKGFTENNLTEIKVIGALQHSHLLGVAITTRHYRNDTEIKPLITDPHYDFDFQELRLLPKEVPVYPGDSFRVDCTYDSTGRTGVTLGGLSTREEMCLTFLYYYPKLSVTNCLSMPTFNNFNISVRQVYNYAHNSDWSNKTVVNDFVSKIDDSQVLDICMEPTQMTGNGTPKAYTPPKPKEYVPPAPQCT